MKAAIALLLCLALVSSKLNTYNIDTSKVTVGGLSSGAFMAV
jgi:predicted peptidase